MVARVMSGGAMPSDGEIDAAIARLQALKGCRGLVGMRAALGMHVSWWDAADAFVGDGDGGEA